MGSEGDPEEREEPVADMLMADPYQGQLGLNSGGDTLKNCPLKKQGNGEFFHQFLFLLGGGMPLRTLDSVLPSWSTCRLRS